MVSLVVKANGVAAVLFHVEHSGSRPWFARWRVTGRYPQAYLHWREVSCSGPRLVIHPEIAGCPIEAQWRWSPSDPWSQAALREAALGECRFHIKAKEDFIAPRGFRAMASVGGFVACYAFGPLDLRAGIETIITGRADGPFPDNVILSPGEFVSEDSLVRIVNEDSSTGSLVIPVDPSLLLSVVAGSAERRVFAVARGPRDNPKSFSPCQA